jgi:hypothetical protein
VTVDPAHPKFGEMKVIVGEGRGSTVKLLALVPVPAASVTAMGPVVAAAGTIAWIVVAFALGMLNAGMPLNLTDDTGSVNVPEIVTSVPAGPCDGANVGVEAA